MLTKMKRNHNGIINKTILAIVALSFIFTMVIGAFTSKNTTHNNHIVSFKYIKPISINSFQQSRLNEIHSIQQKYNINLTPKSINKLGLNEIVLQNLINKSMLNYLAKIYKFDINNDKVIKFVKSFTEFKNHNGKFDLNIFKSTFQNSTTNPEEYLLSIKNYLINNVLLNIFINSFSLPSKIIENTMDYLTEIRTANIIYIDLYHQSKQYQPKTISSQQIKNYYKTNLKQFILPERRSFKYIEANIQLHNNTLDIDTKKYLEKNSTRNPQGQKKDSNLSVSKLTNNLIDNLKKDISCGLTLEDIGTKYQLQIQQINNLSIAELKSNKASIDSQIANHIFSIKKILLPHRITTIIDKNKIFLIELDNITPPSLTSYYEAKQKIISILNKQSIAMHNMQIIKNIQQHFDTKAITQLLLKYENLHYIQNVNFTREQLRSKNNFPQELLQKIFLTKNHNTTDLVSDQKKIYFAFLKQINTDKINQSNHNYKIQLLNIIHKGMFEELLSYLINKNKAKLLYKI
jgi:hypothetical protein